MPNPKLINLTATPHPDGNRIDLSWDLSWESSEHQENVAICVMRRTDRYPKPEDKAAEQTVNNTVIVRRDENITSATDKGLRAETVYYYGILVGQDPTCYQVAAMATGPYGMAEQLYNLLPSIYRRYDAPTTSPQTDSGIIPEPLKRFLELPGGQLDQLYSYTRAAAYLHNPNRVDGRLLPLLGDWIGWRTDFRQDFQKQRNELRQAPYIQETIGTLPAIEATVKRLIGWDCRAKEFVNNIFVSNQPEQYNLWSLPLNGHDKSPQLLSLDFAYEGRPSVAVSTTNEGAQRTWLVYHSAFSRSGVNKGQMAKDWAIRYKTRLSFELDKDEFLADLHQHRISPHWQQQFARHGLKLSLDLDINETTPKTEKSKPSSSDALGSQQQTIKESWVIFDRSTGQNYQLQETDTTLLVLTEWSASKLLLEPKLGCLHRHPSAVYFNDELWVFWDVYNCLTKKWSIEYCRFDGDKTPLSFSFLDEIISAANEHRSPFAVMHDRELWLFWQERINSRWYWRYIKYEGDTWGMPSDFTAVIAVNTTGSAEDLYAISDSQLDGLRLFWVKRRVAGNRPGQTHKRLFHSYWTKESGWETAEGLFPDIGNYDDVEPAASINSNGELELVWSSNRSGFFAIWQSQLKGGHWSTPEPVCKEIDLELYNQRTPLPLCAEISEKTQIIFRSSAPIRRTSTNDSATYTLDTRPCGSISVDTRNRRQIGLHKLYEDSLCYTYDTGLQGKPDNDTWYRRDTVGVYLRAKPDDAAVIQAKRELAEQFLQAILPIHVRLVFIIETPFYLESVFPGHHPLGEATSATVYTVNNERVTGLAESYTDFMLDWDWVKAWDKQNPEAYRNVTNNPRYRIFYKGINIKE